MKKIVSVLLAVLMLCSLTLVAFAATRRFSVIAYTYADASTTLTEADLGTRYETSLKITAQVYKYSSAFMIPSVQQKSALSMPAGRFSVVAFDKGMS